MINKVFFDTNILVYAADRHSPEKQHIARNALRAAAQSHTGVISTQVLQEFYVVATRKLGITPLIVKELLVGFENMEVVQVTPKLVRDSIDTSVADQTSFWDALIIVCAAAAACTKLLTEDLSPGQLIRGIRIENPFP